MKMPKYRFADIAINMTKKRKPTVDDMDTYIGLEHLDSGSLEVTRWGSKVPIKGEKLIMEKGDILFGKRNAYLKRAAIAPHDGLFSAHGMILRPNEEVISPKLFPFFICSDYFFDAAIRISVGSLSPTINWSALKELEFVLPDMEEQEKLAELLWAANNTKEAYKKLIHLTDELVIAQFIEMFGDPNKSVDTVSLEEAFEIRNDLRKPLSDAIRSEMHTGELYPYYGANGQVDMINEYLMDCTALCLAEDCGSYGPGEPTSYIITGKSWVNNHAHVLIPRECCDIEFANIYFKILDMSEYVTGTTRLKLTKGKMREIPFVLHPMDKQKQFATFVQKRDKSVSELQQNIDNLEKIIKALMTKNFG